MSADLEKLKQELAELLDRYDCHLSFSCDDCSDTHGIHGESLQIGRNFPAKPETLKLADGWTANARDLAQQ